MPPAHEIDSASPWVCRWSALIRRGGRVLDVACGHGRHLRYLSSLGFAVVGVDRDEAALAALRGIGGGGDSRRGPRGGGPAFLRPRVCRGGVGPLFYLNPPS